MNRTWKRLLVATTGIAIVATIARPVGAQLRAVTWPATKPETLDAIRQASEAYALDYSCMVALADKESSVGRNPAAYPAPDAPVAGLYQFWSKPGAQGTWEWASAGHFGVTAPPAMRLDDITSAWVAAYLMDMRGGRDWNFRDCKLPGMRRYGATAFPFTVSRNRLLAEWPDDYWERYDAYLEVASDQRAFIVITGCNRVPAANTDRCREAWAHGERWAMEQPAYAWMVGFWQAGWRDR